MYVLSDGTMTTSKKLYLQDALRYAFSISEYTIPGDTYLGVDVNTSSLSAAHRLLFNNICKTIDSSLEIQSITTSLNKIKIVVSYPYGSLEVKI